MFDRPIAAFDIETIPDPEVGRRLWGLTGDDETVVRAMVARRLEETDGKSEYPEQPHHRVVTIGVAWLDPESGRFKLGTCGGQGERAMDERSHLEAFVRLFEGRRSPRIVSWNGGGYDLPVIRYRSMMHGISAGPLYRKDGEFKWNNYQNRYHDMHVDLMDVLSGYGASKWVGLGLLSPLMGLPGKSFLTEAIWEHVLRGEEAVVREYCKMDVLETLLLYLVYAVHCGQLEAARLAKYVAEIRRVLREESFEGWAEIAERLEGWPRWAPGGEGEGGLADVG